MAFYDRLRLASNSGYSSSGAETPVREASASYPPLSMMQQHDSPEAHEMQLQVLQQQLQLHRSQSPVPQVQALKRPSLEALTPIQTASGVRPMPTGMLPVQVLLVVRDPNMAAIFKQQLSQAPIPSMLHIAGETDMWAVVEQVKTMSGRPQGPEFAFFQLEVLISNPGMVAKLKHACNGACTAVVLQGSEPVARALQADDFVPGPTPSHPLRKEDLALTILTWRTRRQNSSSSSTASSVMSAGSSRTGTAPPGPAMPPTPAHAYSAGTGMMLGDGKSAQAAGGPLQQVLAPTQQPAQLQQLHQLQAQLQQLQLARQQQQQVQQGQQQQQLLLQPYSKTQQRQPQPLAGSPISVANPRSPSTHSNEIEPAASGAATVPRPPPLRILSAGVTPSDAQLGPNPSYDRSSTPTPGSKASSHVGIGASDVGELQAQVADLRRKLDDRLRAVPSSVQPGRPLSMAAAEAAAAPGAMLPGAGKATGLPGGSAGIGAGGAGMYTQKLPAMPAPSLQLQQQQQLSQLQQLQQQMQQLQKAMGSSAPVTPRTDSATSANAAVGKGAAGALTMGAVAAVAAANQPVSQRMGTLLPGGSWSGPGTPRSLAESEASGPALLGSQAANLQLQQQLLQLQQMQQQLQQHQQQPRREVPTAVSPATAAVAGVALSGASSIARTGSTSMDALMLSRHTYPNSTGSLPGLPSPTGGIPAANVNDARRSSTSPGGSSSVSRSNSFVAAGGARYRPPRPRSPSPLGSSSGCMSDGYPSSSTSRFAASPNRLGHCASGVGTSAEAGVASGGRSISGNGRGASSAPLTTAKSGDDAIAAALIAAVSDSEGEAPAPAAGSSAAAAASSKPGSCVGSVSVGDIPSGRGSLSDTPGRTDGGTVDGGSSTDGRSAMDASFALDESAGGGRDSISAGGFSSVDLQPNPGTRTGAAAQQQPRPNVGGTRVGSHRLTSAAALSEHTDDESLTSRGSKPATAAAAAVPEAERQSLSSWAHHGPTSEQGSIEGTAGGAGSAAAGGAAAASKENAASKAAAAAAADAAAAAAASEALLLVPHKPPPHLTQQLQQQLQQRRGEGEDWDDSDSMEWWSPAPSTSSFRPTADGGAPTVRSSEGSRRMPTLDGTQALPGAEAGSPGAASAASSSRPMARVDSQDSHVPSIDGTQPIAAAVVDGGSPSRAGPKGAASPARQAGSRLSPISELQGSDRASGSAVSGGSAMSGGSASLAPPAGSGPSFGGALAPSASSYTDDIFAAVHQSYYERVTGSPAPLAPPRPSTPPARRAARILLSSHPIVITRDDFLPQ